MIGLIRQICCKHDWKFENYCDHKMDGYLMYSSKIFYCKKCLKKRKVKLK